MAPFSGVITPNNFLRAAQPLSIPYPTGQWNFPYHTIQARSIVWQFLLTSLNTALYPLRRSDRLEFLSDTAMWTIHGDQIRRTSTILICSWTLEVSLSIIIKLRKCFFSLEIYFPVTAGCTLFFWHMNVTSQSMGATAVLRNREIVEIAKKLLLSTLSCLTYYIRHRHLKSICSGENYQCNVFFSKSQKSHGYEVVVSRCQWSVLMLLLPARGTSSSSSSQTSLKWPKQLKLLQGPLHVNRFARVSSFSVNRATFDTFVQEWGTGRY